MSKTVQSRYHGIEVISIDGLPTLALRPIPREPEAPDALIHTCIGGETLDQLAKEYYGREDLWWRIADANPKRFPFEWKPGEKLVIPPLRTAGRTRRG